MSDTEKPANPPEPKPVFWAQDHRIVFANTFTVRIGDNDIAIEMSTEQNVNGKDVYLSTVQVMMTPASARILSRMLTGLLDKMEKELGPIKISTEKLENIDKLVAASGPAKK